MSPHTQRHPAVYPPSHAVERHATLRGIAVHVNRAHALCVVEAPAGVSEEREGQPGWSNLPRPPSPLHPSHVMMRVSSASEVSATPSSQKVHACIILRPVDGGGGGQTVW